LSLTRKKEDPTRKKEDPTKKKEDLNRKKEDRLMKLKGEFNQEKVEEEDSTKKKEDPNQECLAYHRPSSGLAKSTAEPDKALENGIHVCTSDMQLADEICKLVTEFQHCWEEPEIVRIAPNEHMPINLIDDWHQHKVAAKPYPLSREDRQVLDETFDKLHEKGLGQRSRISSPVRGAGYELVIPWYSSELRRERNTTTTSSSPSLPPLCPRQPARLYDQRQLYDIG
jgi:hypothetical protein